MIFDILLNAITINLILLYLRVLSTTKLYNRSGSKNSKTYLTQQFDDYNLNKM